MNGLKDVWDGVFSMLPTPVQTALQTVGENFSTWWGNVNTWFEKNVAPKFTLEFWLKKFENLKTSFVNV